VDLTGSVTPPRDRGGATFASAQTGQEAGAALHMNVPQLVRLSLKPWGIISVAMNTGPLLTAPIG
jgi:hypothetical protein